MRTTKEYFGGPGLPDFHRAFWPSKVLYMARNGKVMLGTPAFPRQAQWRIVVMPDGIIQLFTNAYPTRLMDSYEACVRYTETVKCQTMVGSSPMPPAKEAGWKIDHSGVFRNVGKADEMEYVFLREYHSSKNLYIHHLNWEGKLCSPSDYDCPGPVGNLLFWPSVFGHVEIPITDSPMTTAGLVFHYIGMGVIIFIAIFLCVMNARLDNKLTHLDDNVLTGPANCIRYIVTCELCAGGRRLR